MHNVATAFEAAQTAAQTFIRETLPAAASRTFRLQRLDLPTLERMSSLWQQVAAKRADGLARHEGHMKYIYPYALHDLRQEGNCRDQPPHLALWQGGEPCAVIIMGTQHKDSLTINYVLTRQDDHALKGNVLGCTHAAASAYAQVAGRYDLIYEGPFSYGSLAQVERGAIPVSTTRRNEMWLGYSLFTPTDAADIPTHERHIPARCLPPDKIDRTYETLYQRLFGQVYSPHV